jgi:hypothetical protein
MFGFFLSLQPGSTGLARKLPAPVLNRMKKFLLLAALPGFLLGAAENTEPAKTGKGGGGPSITQKRDPQQTDGNPTTQVLSTNRPSGAAPGTAVGYNTVDEDLQKRIITALSTGSIGTQGTLAPDQTTDIKVTVTNRQVTLKGEVISDKSKQALGKRVAGLDGVKGVNNQLTVNPNAKPKRADLVRPDGYSPGNTKTSPTAPKQ